MRKKTFRGALNGDFSNPSMVWIDVLEFEVKVNPYSEIVVVGSVKRRQSFCPAAIFAAAGAQCFVIRLDMPYRKEAPEGR